MTIVYCNYKRKVLNKVLLGKGSSASNPSRTMQGMFVMISICVGRGPTQLLGLLPPPHEVPVGDVEHGGLPEWLKVLALSHPVYRRGV